MAEQVLELLKKLRPCTEDEELLLLLCRTACSRLEGMLKNGVTPEDCGESYLLAAAWLAMDWLEDVGESANITSLSAGDLTVRRESGSGGTGKNRAMELLAPYLKTEGFVFRGVKG